MARIRQSDIEEVRSRTNIAEIVGEHVALKNAGIGSMKGLCPFHDEKTPSFHVRPQAGFFKCFGCGEGGDVYTFLEKIDHCTFGEAVERLAERIGYTLQYEDGEKAADSGNRVRLLRANDAAAAYFQEQLQTPGADHAKQFLGERGFSQVAARDFGVGYAPKGWDNLTKHLRSLGFSNEELATAGLVSAGDRGSYDRFRGRLMWPVRDVSGQVVGFGARRLFDDDKGPKYLNTPETPVYHKSQLLYGLDKAKRNISREHRVVVVEGYTDVMACHLAGVTTAVATCGTAFGADHIRTLRRILGDDSTSGEVIFTFDPDAAGQKAALRAFSEEKRFVSQTYVAVAPEGYDPCDLRLTRGDAAVRRLVETKRPMFEFAIRQTLQNHNLETVEGRVGALRQAAPMVADIRDASLRPGYTRELAGWLGMDVTEVERAVRYAAGRKHQSDTPDAPAETPIPVASMRQLGADPTTRLERDATMAMLQQPGAVDAELFQRAVLAEFANPTLQTVKDGILAALGTQTQPDWVRRVASEVPAPFRSLVEELSVAPLEARSESALPRYVKGLLSAVIDRDLLHQKAELLGSLQRVDKRAEPERAVSIQQQLEAVDRERRRYRDE